MKYTRGHVYAQSEAQSGAVLILAKALVTMLNSNPRHDLG